MAAKMPEFTCQKCWYFFPTAAVNQRHINRKKCQSKKRKREEGSIEDYNCPVCGLSFVSTMELMNNGSTGLGCTECSPVFTTITEAMQLQKQRQEKRKKSTPTPPAKKEGLRSKELVPEDRKLFFTIVSLMIAADKRNSCAIPYKKLNATTYEQFLTPEQRTIVERLKL